MKITRESWVILAIGVIDLTTTLFWVNNYGAQEGNPIFSYYLAMGPFWFILAKFVCLLCPILIFEFAKHHRPRYAMNGARVAIAGYVFMYIVGVAKLNLESAGEYNGQSVSMGTLGAPWGSGHLSIAEHTFQMPMNVTDSYPLEGIR